MYVRTHMLHIASKVRYLFYQIVTYDYVCAWKVISPGASIRTLT